jgi:hypothetical protein
MISREDLVEQSVTDYVRNAVFVERNYPAEQVELLESFPFKMEAFEKNYIALGFNFDDDGTQAELGSDLLRRIYTLEFWVFGQTTTYARNLANIVKFAAQKEQSIPLKDISQDPAPIIDYMEVLGVSAQRQIVPDPEPFQQYVWTTVVRVEDVYHASLV